MRLLPRSLFGRNAMLLVVLLLTSQVATLLLFAFLVVNPQASRIAAILAQNIRVVSTTLAALPPDQRQDLIMRLDASPYLDFAPGDQPPQPLANGTPNPLEHYFLQILVDRLHFQDDMVWRMGAGRVLWVRINLADQFYWIASRAPSTLDPILAIALSAGAVFGLVVFFGVLLTRQISNPLRKLEEAADSVSLGAAIETIAPGGPSEIRALAKSFNQMTKRITAAESERAFILAGVSHDLRTPLAKLSLAVEMIPEAGEMRDMAARQVVQMDRLVGQFLDYARGFEAEASTRVDLAGLLRETVAEIDDQRRVRLVAPVYLVATVRREAIRRATINLVDNALNHGGADVVLTLTRTGNQFEIIASDKGPGVAAEALAGLAQPFRRGPNVGAANGGVANGGGSAGAGLGLAIVARIAAEHCGRLELRNRPGGGFEAVFQAPIAAPGSIGP